MMVDGREVAVMLANPFAPVMVSAPEPPWLSVGYVKMPPPANVFADADVRLIVPVPVTVVIPAVADHALPLPWIVQVPEPKAMVLFAVPNVATDPATVTL